MKNVITMDFLILFSLTLEDSVCMTYEASPRCLSKPIFMAGDTSGQKHSVSDPRWYIDVTKDRRRVGLAARSRAFFPGARDRRTDEPRTHQKHTLPAIHLDLAPADVPLPVTTSRRRSFRRGNLPLSKTHWCSQPERKTWDERAGQEKNKK